MECPALQKPRNVNEPGRNKRQGGRLWSAYRRNIMGSLTIQDGFEPYYAGRPSEPAAQLPARPDPRPAIRELRVALDRLREKQKQSAAAGNPSSQA